MPQFAGQYSWEELLQRFRPGIEAIRTVAMQTAVRDHEPFFIEHKDEFVRTEKSSPEYIDHFIAVLNQLVGSKAAKTVMNKDGLKAITNTTEPHIFLINHSIFAADYWMSGNLLKELYESYRQNDKAEQCPRPLILANQTFPDALKSTALGPVLEHYGLQGIYLGNDGSLKQTNKVTLDRIATDFYDGKINYFLAPEGKNVWNIGAPLEERFQSGISKFIYSMAEKFESSGKRDQKVHVVPVGFYYKPIKSSEKQHFSIYVGKPFSFKKVKNQLKVYQDNKPMFVMPIRKNELDSSIDRISGLLTNQMNLAKISAKQQIDKD